MLVTNQCKKCNKFFSDCKCFNKIDQLYKDLEQDFTRTDIDRMPFIETCPRCRNTISYCRCRPNMKWLTELQKENEQKKEAIKKYPTVLDIIADIADLVETTPNDVELGAAVRKLFEQ